MMHAPALVLASMAMRARGALDNDDVEIADAIDVALQPVTTLGRPHSGRCAGEDQVSRRKLEQP